jgi:WS/DGAT/MGAT family acyltransferase
MPPPFVAPRTGFNAPITGSRAAAFASLDLTEVKRVKDAFGVKVNDLVLTVCSGALRRYLAERDGLPDTSLVAMVPVSMHGRSDRAEGTNKLSGMFHSLASDIADPVERLRAIASHSHAAKEHHRTLSADLLQDWAQFAPPVVFGLLMRGYSRLRLAEKHPVIHNLVISNVPGPQFPVYFLGARVRGFFPFGPIFDGAGLNITVISREGGMDFGLLGCADLVPDIGELADAIPAEFAALRAAADRLSAVTRG